MNYAMITQPLNTKLQLMRKPEQLKFKAKEASGFRNKVTKIILAETNTETFNTFIGYVISLHLL